MQIPFVRQAESILDLLQPSNSQPCPQCSKILSSCGGQAMFWVVVSNQDASYLARSGMYGIFLPSRAHTHLELRLMIRYHAIIPAC